ncbi:acyl-CoA N-acyltransferase [Lasiosphaeris hirsuta]|uniref:Acyl-CoA N-acyltransferase n=1 Tax=Lasiosphaeris hirsuta TaxID=260670 RepID=A0AA40E5M0_9PEZI|nr:acyl-CoA N-acyltransferase [Lasiosphaeris hirsuta]
MPLHIRQATEEDAPVMARIARDAFLDTVSAILFPPHLRSLSPIDQEIPWRTARTIKRMRQGIDTVVVVDTADDGSETVIAFVQWEPPAELMKHSDNVEEEAVPATLDIGSLQTILRVLDTQTEEALGPEGHSKMWYVMMLAVDPNHYRRGAGRMLIRQGLQRAASQGRSVYLSATPEGKPLYESLGFKTLVAHDLFGESYDAMLWTPTTE